MECACVGMDAAVCNALFVEGALLADGKNWFWGGCVSVIASELSNRNIDSLLKSDSLF